MVSVAVSRVKSGAAESEKYTLIWQVLGGVIVPVQELPFTMKSAGTDTGTAEAPEFAPVKVIGACPDSVSVICCAALTAGVVPVGMPKERSVGEADTGGAVCAGAPSATSNNSGLLASKIASFFIFIAGRASIIRPSFWSRAN